MFVINQIFEITYPPEAAIWCNKNNAYIEEIETVDGVRRFQIVAIPEPTPEEINEQRKQEIYARLNAIDTESLRPLRAIARGTATDYDTEKLKALEDEAVALRQELASL